MLPILRRYPVRCLLFLLMTVSLIALPWTFSDREAPPSRIVIEYNDDDAGAKSLYPLPLPLPSGTIQSLPSWSFRWRNI